jgi:hypothetical protein
MATRYRLRKQIMEPVFGQIKRGARLPPVPAARRRGGARRLERNGTATVFAALGMLDGEVIAGAPISQPLRCRSPMCRTGLYA